MANLTLRKALGGLGDIYQSVSVKIAAVAESPSQQSWWNRFLVITFSHESIEETKKFLEEHQRKHGFLKGDHIRVIQQVYSYENFNFTIWPCLMNGNSIFIDGTFVTIGKKFGQDELLNKEGAWKKEKSFPRIEYYFTESPEFFQKTNQIFSSSQVTHELEISGFSQGAFPTINTLIETPENLPSYDTSIIFRCIVPVLMDKKPKVKIITNDSIKINIEAKCHRKMELFATLNLMKTDRKKSNKGKFYQPQMQDVMDRAMEKKEQLGKKTYKLIPIGSASNLIEDRVVEFNFESINPHDPNIWVTINLHNGILGIVGSWEGFSLRELMDIAERNPLYKTLTLFCPEQDVITLLTKPQIASGIRNAQPQHKFEVSMTWLLSLLGFSVIWLHDYDVLKHGSTKVAAGAADIIGYHFDRNMLIVIQCTFLAKAIANEKHSLQQTCQKIEDDILTDNGFVHLIPVLVCGERVSQELRDQFESPSKVLLFDSLDIENMLSKIREGQEENVLKTYFPDN